jgi:hypothetical protein
LTDSIVIVASISMRIFRGSGAWLTQVSGARDLQAPTKPQPSTVPKITLKGFKNIAFQRFPTSPSFIILTLHCILFNHYFIPFLSL